MKKSWDIKNPQGSKRVLVTKKIPGTEWIDFLIKANCRIEIFCSNKNLNSIELIRAIGKKCDGIIGQLSENWNENLLTVFSKAGGKVYSNYAVGYNNIDINTATKLGIAICNTPNVLTKATAELAVALTFATSRRIIESEQFINAGKFKGWEPKLFLGSSLNRGTVGIIGVGRIGSAYAHMMVEGHKMNVLYYSRKTNQKLENYFKSYSKFIQSQGNSGITCYRVKNIEELLEKSDCVSIHTSLNESTYHIINAKRLSIMKKNAILINTSRGPIIDEKALIKHCIANPDFRVGLDVFENEPSIPLELIELDNIITTPHIGSSTQSTRKNMSIMASINIVKVLKNHFFWNNTLLPKAIGYYSRKMEPSILNAEHLNM